MAEIQSSDCGERQGLYARLSERWSQHRDYLGLRRAAEPARFLHFSLSEFTNRHSRQPGNLHNLHRGGGRVYRGRDIGCERLAGRRDREFRAGDGDRIGEFDADGDDEWNDRGGDISADHHGDERNPDSNGECVAGGERDATAPRLQSDGDAGDADGGGGEYDDVHGQHRGVERVRWGGDAECEWVAGGHDGEFRAGDGDGVGEIDADGDDEWNDAGGDVSADHYRDERQSDAHGEYSVGGEWGCDRDQVRGSGHGDGEYGSGRSGCPVELE